jgi:hypothetical protein
MACAGAEAGFEVGVHDAGLTNMVFLPRDAMLIQVVLSGDKAGPMEELAGLARDLWRSRGAAIPPLVGMLLPLLLAAPQ